MKITHLFIGKTEEAWLQEGIEKYEKRLRHYISSQILIIPALKQTKSLSEAQQKTKEGEELLAKLETSDILILLDEKGKEYSSEEFSVFLQKQMLSGAKHIVFAVGGPYGFSEQVYQRAQHKIALSRMTFSHQMVRLFWMEQVYRAFTLLKGESYHHK